MRSVDPAAATDFSWRRVVAAPRRFAYRRSHQTIQSESEALPRLGNYLVIHVAGDCSWQINQDLGGRPGSPHMQMKQV